ncbi:MFS transporter [Myxococcota bacterium]|nr:MFS transporter [Myxococcota bacterium]
MPPDNEPATDAGTPLYSHGYVRYVLGVMFAVMVFNTVDRYVMSILLEPIKHDLGLTDRQLGWLVGFAFTAVYAITSIPLARLADRGMRRSVIAGGLFAWSLFTAATSLAQNFFQMFLLRMAVGVGEAAGSSPGQALISDYVPPERRARGLSIISLGAVAGLALGMMGGGWINELWGWRMAFLAAGLPGILLALLVRLTVREPPRGWSEGRVPQSRETPMRETVKYLFGFRSFSWVLAASAAALFASMGRNLWEPSFLIRIYDLGTGAAGTWYFLTSPLPSALGIYLGGFLCDRWSRRDRRWFMGVPILGQTLSVPFLVAFVLWPESHRLPLPGGLPDLPVALLFSVVASTLGSWYTAPMLAIVQNLARPPMRAMAAAVSSVVTAFLGHGLGPLLVGDLNTRLEPTFGEEAIRYSLLLVVTAPLLSAALCAGALGSIRGDLARAQQAGNNETPDA